MGFNRGTSRPSNITALRSEIEPFIKADKNNVLRVDKEGLIKFILEQFEYALNLQVSSLDRNRIRNQNNLQASAQQIANALESAFVRLSTASDFPAGSTSAATRVGNMIAIRDQAAALTHEMEAEHQRRVARLGTDIAELVNREGAGAFVKIDPDRIIDSRFYISTFVTDWGEESAPSPVSEMLEVDQNDAVSITCPSVPNGRFIEKWRLYRSNVGTNAAQFQLVDEMLASTPTYKDELKGEQLGEVCPTTTWAEPPVRRDMQSAATIKPVKGSDPYLRGLVGMPNGVMAGFLDNMVAFCDPYHLYAWPVEYQISIEYPVVGLGVFGQTLFVGTRGNPYLISGSDSASMSAIKLDAAQSCASRRSIVSAGNGVFYASPDGLCFASSNGVELITSALFAREDWQALDPGSIIAAAHEGVYYFFYNGQGGGCYALDMGARKLVHTDMRASAICTDALSDGLYYTQDGQILHAFATGRRTGLWKSGCIVLPTPAALAWLQIDGDQTPQAPVTLRWYGDGTLRHSATVTSTAPQRLPIGRWLEHEVEIETRARLTKVLLASSTLELQNA